MRGHIRAQESKEMYQRMFYMGKVVVMAISYFLSFFAVAVVIAWGSSINFLGQISMTAKQQKL